MIRSPRHNAGSCRRRVRPHRPEFDAPSPGLVTSILGTQASVANRFTCCSTHPTFGSFGYHPTSRASAASSTLGPGKSLVCVTCAGELAQSVSPQHLHGSRDVDEPTQRLGERRSRRTRKELGRHSSHCAPRPSGDRRDGRVRNGYIAAANNANTRLCENIHEPDGIPEMRRFRIPRHSRAVHFWRNRDRPVILHGRLGGHHFSDWLPLTSLTVF